MRKAVELGYAWTCSNMDLLAPIEERFVVALFDDGSQDRYNGEPVCTAEEKQDYARKNGYAFVGDEIVIVSGRKMKGEHKTLLKQCFYRPTGTYGHADVDYFYFTDGTKVQKQHCRVVGFEGCRSMRGIFSGFHVGGRL